MVFFYGKKNSDFYGFFLDNENFIDNKYVEVDEETHDAIINQVNEEQGKLSADEDGNPIVIPRPEPSNNEKAEREIQSLQSYLSSTDWYAIRFADTGEEIPSDIKKQRQEARDRISELRETLKSESE